MKTSLHVFNDVNLETLAFTHRSFGRPNNERLEWLGDSLLQSAVSTLLYGQFNDLNESGLTQARAQLVGNATLAQLARREGLVKHIRLGTPRQEPSDRVIAGVMEALIAAIYLDDGDLQAVIARLLDDDIVLLKKRILEEGIMSLSNAKSHLQEYLQKRGKNPPVYRTMKKDGPAHNPTFYVECVVDDDSSAQGCGRSITAAQQSAAGACLKKLL